jgi:hypothetical protein
MLSGHGPCSSSTLSWSAVCQDEIFSPSGRHPMLWSMGHGKPVQSIERIYLFSGK